MKIDFSDDGKTIFAISLNTFHNGLWHDELIWAEIEKGDRFVLHWEDDYVASREEFKTLDLAKQEILLNYHHHKPHSNGASYEED